MGAPMAGHLLDAGHELTVHNRTRERELPLAERGAARAATPAEAAAGVDAVLICVSDTPDLEAVLFGGDGVARGLAAGGTVVDCSTVSPSATAELAERLAAQGIGLVDAPVSGGSEGAQNGTSRSSWAARPSTSSGRSRSCRRSASASRTSAPVASARWPRR